MKKLENLEGVHTHTHTHTHTQYKFNRKNEGSRDYFKSVGKENRDLLGKYIKIFA